MNGRQLQKDGGWCTACSRVGYVFNLICMCVRECMVWKSLRRFRKFFQEFFIFYLSPNVKEKTLFLRFCGHKLNKNNRVSLCHVWYMPCISARSFKIFTQTFSRNQLKRKFMKFWNQINFKALFCLVFVMKCSSSQLKLVSKDGKLLKTQSTENLFFKTIKCSLINSRTRTYVKCKPCSIDHWHEPWN